VDTQNIYKALPERRHHPRVRVQMSLPCIRLDPANVNVLDTLHMLDISRSGIGAYSERSYYPGQRLVLVMPLFDSRGRRSIYASVVRCSRDREGYRIGVKFDSAIVGAFCQPAAPHAATAA